MKMTDDDLATLVADYASRALNRDGADLSGHRQDILNAYRGDSPDTPPKGMSKYVSRVVYETVEWMFPSVIRAFLANRRAIEFNPRTVEDVKAAKQETDAVNYTIFEQNEGFMAVAMWVKDALLMPNAYAKKYMDERVCVSEETYTGVTERGVQDLLEHGKVGVTVELLERSAAGEVMLPVQDPMTGQTQFAPFPVYDVRVKRIETKRKPRLVTLPPEQVLIDADWTGIDLDECPFVAHEDYKQREELLAMGVDEALLEDISGAREEGVQYGTERDNRQRYEDEDGLSRSTSEAYDEATKQFWVTEAYVRVDYDDDGYAELRRVLVCGNTVLLNDMVDYMPIMCMSAIPVPHSHIGMSPAESVMDLQDLKTVLMRQTLNNLYNINTRRTFVSEEAFTDDGQTAAALTNPRATHIKVRGVPGNMVMPEQQQGVLNETAPLLEMVDNMRRIRSGVSPETSLDPDVLRETTAHAFASAQDAASQRVETIVRILAETGIKKLFLKTHQLLRMHADQPLLMELRGEWVEVNPSDWRERTDVRITIGLGYNGTQQMVAALTQTLAQQQALAPMGLATAEEIYATVEKLCEALNIGHAPQFFVDPKGVKYKPPQPKPDPAMVQAQAYMEEVRGTKEVKMAELQANAQKAVAESALAQEKLRLESARMEIELQLKEIELQGKTTMDAHSAALGIEEKKAIIALQGAQAMREQEQSLYFHAMAEKAMVEAENSRRALPSEVKLTEAKAASERKKAEENPAEGKTE